MQWLLACFPEYRRLKNELSELRETNSAISNERLRLQDRLEDCLVDRSKMWGLLCQSIEEMKISYQAHINQAWQRHGGGIPYPDAPHLPASAVPQEQSKEPIGRRGRVFPSEVVQQKTADFIQNLARVAGK